MKHPSKEQVQIVIDTLTKAKEMVIQAGYESCPVNMDVGNIHPCGTPMCHGGYYALAKRKTGSKVYDYTDGADLMAQDLELVNQYDLQEWADENPEIWGNSEGFQMFADDSAFGVEKVNDLQVIIDHWKGVKERLPQ